MSLDRYPDHFPEITLKKAILREINPILDAEKFFNYMSASEVKKFTTDNNLPKDLLASVEELKYWYMLYYSKLGIYWAISNHNGDIIGTAGFNRIDADGKADISYDLDYNYWGRGIMQEALEAILELAFTMLRVQKIQATVAVHNHKSIKLLEKLSFTKETFMENYEILGGKLTNYYMYSKLS